MTAMFTEDLEDMSAYYWLKNLFTDTPLIKIVSEFPQGDLQVPSISIEPMRINTVPWEMGNPKTVKFRRFVIEIFASNITQRKQCVYKILNELDKAKIPVFNYEQGFPPDVTPLQIGSMDVAETVADFKRVFPAITEKLYYRATVTFVAVLTTF
jgi:hypothetical protein